MAVLALHDRNSCRFKVYALSARTRSRRASETSHFQRTPRRHWAPTWIWFAFARHAVSDRSREELLLLVLMILEQKLAVADASALVVQCESRDDADTVRAMEEVKRSCSARTHSLPILVKSQDSPAASHFRGDLPHRHSRISLVQHHFHARPSFPAGPVVPQRRAHAPSRSHSAAEE